MASLRESTRNLRLWANYLLLFDRQESIELDSIVGNKDGRFELPGQGVSETLKNAYSDGLVIYGDLLCEDGSWQRATVDLNEAVFSGDHFPGLVRHLNTFIGNEDGVLVKGTDFTQTARNVRILGDYLYADLQDLNGNWKASSYGLWQRYHQWDRLKDVIGYHGPTDRVDVTTQKYLGKYITLVSCDLTLEGDCQHGDQYVQSDFDLASVMDNNVSGAFGKLIPRQPDDVYYFFEPQLVGTILQTSLMGMGSWNMHRSALDLNAVLENENGELALSTRPPFCPACASLFSGGALRREESWISMIPGEDCLFCDLLRRGQKQYAPGSRSSDSVKIKKVPPKEIHGLEEILVCFTCGDTETVTQLFSTSDRWEDSVHFRTLPKREPPKNLTGSSVLNSEVALRWIDHCVRSHDKCDNAKIGALPARVLQISNDQLRLVESGKDRTYACLSYCWGPEPPRGFMLVKEKLSAYGEAIDISSVPQTVQDAIAFARTINIDFLWIDALCIIQDDTHDWEIQSARMKDYYANCLVCISANGSSTVSEGCKIEPFPEVLSLTGQGQDNLPYSIVLISDEMSGGHFKSEDFPLLTRGWAYQERRLAPRIIHFCKHELMFECRNGTTCECGGNPEDTSNIWTKSYRPPVHVVGSSRYRDLARTVIDESIIIWQADVYEYSRRELTFVTDKLPAISGLAKLDKIVRWRDKTYDRGKYLAGVWSGHLPFDLMWRLGTVETSIESKPADRYEYLAPSWSWASVHDAPVEFWITPCGWVIDEEQLCWQRTPDGSDRFGSLIKVTDGDTVTGIDPTGRSESGFLDVTGRIISAEWSTEDPKRPTLRERSIDSSEQPSAESQPTGASGQPILEEQLVRLTADKFDGLFFPDHTLHEGQPDHECSLLPVYWPIDYGYHQGKECLAVFYLVLRRVDSRSFKRIGSAVGRVTAWEDISDPWDHFPAVRQAEWSRFLIV